MGAIGLENSDAGFDQHRCSSPLWMKSYILPDLASVNRDSLLAAEESAHQVLTCIQPTSLSEKRRKNMVDYLQKLIRSNCNCEIFPYGSVPLRTYLPDGDIDFTAFRRPEAEESIARDVFALISREQDNKDAEYRITDTQFIDAAEVKLVKCIMQNVVIDISFNQLGGLSTLCFLELIDEIVGRNHLFKRSIILIKAWCHYESRLLGSNRGLLSTYALEILILYIIHHFYSSLHGPISVLYQFLSYYSQFDWDNYYISLKGPVCKSSLPDIVVKKPTGFGVPLLTKKLLDNCIQMFCVTSRLSEATQRKFQAKFLNIIDPLNPTNNLGRSVQQASFYRIRSAFKYGASKLGEVLSQPREKVGDELSEFFRTTLIWHQKRYRNAAPENRLESLSMIERFGTDRSYTSSLGQRKLGSIRNNPLADLTGDYENHIDSLLNCQKLNSLLSSSSAVYKAASLFRPNVKQTSCVRQRIQFGAIQFSELTSYSTDNSSGQEERALTSPVWKQIPRDSYKNKSSGYYCSKFYRHGFIYDSVVEPEDGIKPVRNRCRQGPPHQNNWFLIGSHRVELRSADSFAEEHFSSSYLANGDSCRCDSPKALGFK